MSWTQNLIHRLPGVQNISKLTAHLCSYNCRAFLKTFCLPLVAHTIVFALARSFVLSYARLNLFDSHLIAALKLARIAERILQTCSNLLVQKARGDNKKQISSKSSRSYFYVLPEELFQALWKPPAFTLDWQNKPRRHCSLFAMPTSATMCTTRPPFAILHFLGDSF